MMIDLEPRSRIRLRQTMLLALQDMLASLPGKVQGISLFLLLMFTVSQILQSAVNSRMRGTRLLRQPLRCYYYRSDRGTPSRYLIL